MSKPADQTKPAEQPAEPVKYSSVYPGIAYPHAPGGAITFKAGRYETASPEQIAYLDQRDTCQRAK